MIAPLIAPAIGAFIIHFYSWQYIFMFLGLYSLFVAFMVWKNIQETLVYVKQSAVKSYISVITHNEAKWLILLFGLVFSGAFIFIAKAAFVYIEYFGVSTDWFPLLFGADMIFIMIMARANIKLIQKYKIISVIKFGIFMQVLFSIALLFLLLHPNLWIMFILLTLYLGMLGIITGNLTALILEHFPNNSGTASATLGVFNVTMGGIIATIVTLFHDGTLNSVAIGIFITTIMSYLLIYKVYRK